ncbi:MAG: zinc ABC transporter substrate-binding protein, partial [Clostridia bacterium]|nr:zinc ABC transporter substrate-binding protein [Clostridia bacterium]
AANGAAYREKLAALDTRFAEEIEKAPMELLIFADRFPFRYLTEDYSLEYEAAFSGCSADSEASFETVVRLSDKLNESGVSSLMILESSTEDLAKTVISNSGREGIRIIRIDSMQSITSRDIERGETYLSIMEKNLAALIAALN